jgi:hypothetical protein
MDIGVALDAGSYSLSGQTLGLVTDTGVALDAGSYSLVGQALGVNSDVTVGLEVGSYGLVGYDLSIILAGYAVGRLSEEGLNKFILSSQHIIDVVEGKNKFEV